MVCFSNLRGLFSLNYNFSRDHILHFRITQFGRFIPNVLINWCRNRVMLKYFFFIVNSISLYIYICVRFNGNFPPSIFPWSLFWGWAKNLQLNLPLIYPISNFVEFTLPTKTNMVETFLSIPSLPKENKRTFPAAFLFGWSGSYLVLRCSNLTRASQLNIFVYDCIKLSSVCN